MADPPTPNLSGAGAELSDTASGMAETGGNDIDHRNEVEKALRVSSFMFSAFFELGPDALSPRNSRKSS
jgi:hypothetical protein